MLNERHNTFLKGFFKDCMTFIDTVNESFWNRKRKLEGKPPNFSASIALSGKTIYILRISFLSVSCLS